MPARPGASSAWTSSAPYAPVLSRSIALDLRRRLIDRAAWSGTSSPSRGSARPPARSARGRSRAGVRSPPACRRSRPSSQRPRPRSRSTASSSESVEEEHGVEPRPISASISSSASAWARFRGKPSSTKPSRASVLDRRSRINADGQSSGTRSPLARIGSTRRPSSVPAAIAGAEHVARRDVREPWRGRDPLCLRPLAGPLRGPSHEQSLTWRKPS